MGKHSEVARVGPDGKWRLDDGTEVVPDDVTQFPVPLAARQGVFAHLFKFPTARSSSYCCPGGETGPLRSRPDAPSAKGRCC